MWFRVFSMHQNAPAPDKLVGHLRGLGLQVEGHFGGDDLGWFKVDFSLAGKDALRVERYLATEDDIRDELNSWAAWLETVDTNPHVPLLMQHMISSQQVFTFTCPRDRFEEAEMSKLCFGLCQYLAQTTQGVYQIDQKGFFAADGTLLVNE